VLAGVVLVVGSGFRLATPMIRSAEAPSGRALPPPVPAASPPAATASSAPPPPVVADPVRLRIPAIALDAPVVGLALDARGAIDVPTRWGDVGWYRPGVAPGAVGPAVLVGHYDSKSGPAVFYRLASVLPGDQLVVAGASGISVTFVVDRLQTVSKAAFPTQEIYGPVTRPEIRLITCDGAFNESTHHYVDNLVVFGHAVAAPAAPAAPAPLAPAGPVARAGGATAAVAPAGTGPATDVTGQARPALSPATPTTPAASAAGVASTPPLPPRAVGLTPVTPTPPPPTPLLPTSAPPTP
jgi:sortase (surface protein transpeptidase)